MIEIAICSILAVIGLLTAWGIYLGVRKHLPPAGRAMALCAMAYFCYIAYPFAAEKRVSFLQTDPEIAYLIDTGSYVTNNAVHLEFSTRYLPESAMLYLDYIPATEPADSLNYSTAVSGPLSEFPNPLTLAFENATSNRWVFYTTYTPGANVHTNGVAVAEFLRSPKYPHVAIPFRATIHEDGELVWPKEEYLNRSADLLNALGEEE